MANLSKDKRLMCVWCRQWVPNDTVTQLVAACTLGVGSQHRGPLVPESEWNPDRYKLPSNERPYTTVDVRTGMIEIVASVPRLRATVEKIESQQAEIAKLNQELAEAKESRQRVVREWTAFSEETGAQDGRHQAEITHLRTALETFLREVKEVSCDLFGIGTAIIKAEKALAGSPSETSGEQRLTLDTSRQVFFYEQDHYYLSNFSAFRLHWKGINFDTSEAAYHWEKFPDSPIVRREIAHARSAHDAFKIAEESRSLRREDWDGMKVDLMRDILRAKATQHEYVRRKLLQTGDRELIENSWRDAFWGWGPNRDGQNMLGKLWMDVRAELRSAQET